MLYHARSDVLFQQVDDEGVLLSLGEEVYFGVNEPAARAWQLLERQACSMAAVVAHLALAYPDVPKSTLSADVAELLAELESNGLVERVAAVADVRASPQALPLTRAS